MPPKKFEKSSLIWNFFKPQQGAEGIAICNLCHEKLSYKSTSGNLRKHIQRKHPSVQLNVSQTTTHQLSTSQSLPSTSSGASTSTDSKGVKGVGAVGVEVIQQKVSTFLKRKIPQAQKLKFDEALMLLFIYDFQPFSIVEDYGFKNFVSVLNPSYQLPSRRQLPKLCHLQHMNVFTIIRGD